ncbi:MAG TPA: PadR family transcriptional regulator [Gemmatirosa sp.]|nr:PadR family transcriptional regulator [Gemmatirosa sp.]
MADAEIDLLRSSLDLLILKALSWGPRHGYGVAEWIEQATADALLVEEGTLYPALHRLERKGWVQSEWGISENNRRAKFYRHTAAGRAQFRSEAPAWHRCAEAIANALRATSPNVAGA